MYKRQIIHNFINHEFQENIPITIISPYKEQLNLLIV